MILFPETWKAHVHKADSCHLFSYQPSLYSPGAGHGLYQGCFFVFFFLIYSILWFVFFFFPNISV